MRTWIILALILALAAFLRLWQLDVIPPSAFRDVTINGNDALNALQTGHFKVFYPNNTGREGLFINLVAVSFFIFGAKLWAIRVVAAVCGILTVLGTYLVAKDLVKDKSVALLSSFFLAVSFWHILISRVGFRVIMVPFILTFAVYFLLKAFRKNNLFYFIVAGILWGLGFYTYIAFRLSVLLLVAILILKRNLRSSVVFLATTFLVALPIGLYFLHNPQDFISRTSDISVFSQVSPIGVFISSLISHLAMFNFLGDGNWRHNYAGSPMLYWPVGLLFLGGIVLTIQRFKKAIIEHSILFVWFFAMLLPGALTYSGIPHSLRVLGVIPVVYIFAGIGGIELYRWLVHPRRRKKLIIAICLILLVLIALAGFNQYFFVWAKDPHVGKAYTLVWEQVIQVVPGHLG